MRTRASLSDAQRVLWTYYNYKTRLVTSLNVRIDIQAGISRNIFLLRPISTATFPI
jgi:hypothetical protein